jgi:hypothetical protein
MKLDALDASENSAASACIAFAATRTGDFTSSRRRALSATTEAPSEPSESCRAATLKILAQLRQRRSKLRGWTCAAVRVVVGR